jgi:hypothetical protein
MEEVLALKDTVLPCWPELQPPDYGSIFSIEKAKPRHESCWGGDDLVPAGEASPGKEKNSFEREPCQSCFLADRQFLITFPFISSY